MAREESKICLYDLLYNSCGIVITNLPSISRHSDCPHEINKTVSTLAFATLWCPDFPKVLIIRQLFFKHYNKTVSRISVEVALTRKCRKGWSIRGTLFFLMIPRFARFVR
ncbi:unnamed protein product [Linum trigynum]|uniref:Uncharacterized protein n=1 Tax=Linum trigynum TaxID=586398 RepID=A0AAV2EN82_9ROSI